MSAVMPDRLARVHGDEGLTWLTDREQWEYDLMIDRKAESLIGSEAWWEVTLCGCNDLERVLPAALARVMGNLDRACKGELIGLQAITTALSEVQRTALGMARKEVEE